jgi:hypothetical protein
MVEIGVNRMMKLGIMVVKQGKDDPDSGYDPGKDGIGRKPAHKILLDAADGPSIQHKYRAILKFDLDFGGCGVIWVDYPASLPFAPLHAPKKEVREGFRSAFGCRFRSQP